MMFRRSYLGILIFFLFSFVIVGAVLDHHSSRKKNEELLSILSLRDSTIVEQEGLVRRSTLKNVELSSLLDSSRENERVLLVQLKRSKEKMFALTNVVVSLRKEYVALLKAEQEDVP